MEPRNVGVSTGRKGSQDIQGLCTLLVGLHHVVGVVSAGFFREFFLVDDVSTVGRKRDAVPGLIGFRAGLGELAGHSSHLDDGHGGSKGQDECHLEEDTEGITDVIDVEFVEGFRAITTHQQKSLSAAGTGQLFVEGSDLSGKDQGRAFLELVDGVVVFFFVLVIWGLGTRFFLPRGGRPRFSLAGFGSDVENGCLSRYGVRSKCLGRVNAETNQSGSSN
mmetsp:Transcript_18455/g.37774  ORF Transcript_18455/g.37774 Transcript_18455/m.37774 type:complete len:220 (+) Transcript_18455:1024-1683(+)